MKRLLLLATLACGTLPHPVERSIGYNYADCVRDEKQGSGAERRCRAEADAKCKNEKFHETCWIDYAYDARSR